MSQASNRAEFEDAVRRQRIPCFTISYADREGHILSLFNGHASVRQPGEIDETGYRPVSSPRRQAEGNDEHLVSQALIRVG